MPSWLGWPLWNICVHGYVPLVISTSRFFPHSWLITGFVTRLTWRVSLVEQELLTLPEHLSSSPVFSGVCVTWSLILCVCLVDHKCLSFFRLAIVLSVLWYTHFDYLPLVSSNSSYFTSELHKQNQVILFHARSICFSWNRSVQYIFCYFNYVFHKTDLFNIFFVILTKTICIKV